MGLSSAAAIARGARNIGRRLGAPLLKMRHSKTNVRSLICGTAPWVEVGVKLAFFSGVQKCPELRGKWGFRVSDLEMGTRNSKPGSSKNGQHLFLGLRPSSFLCFWVSRLEFTKNGFRKIDRISLKTLKTLDGQNRQSPIASVQRARSTLAGHSAIPHETNVKRMNTNRAIRIAEQRTQGL